MIEQCRVARDPIEDLLKLISDLRGLQVQVELRARAGGVAKTPVRTRESETAIACDFIGFPLSAEAAVV